MKSTALVMSSVATRMAFEEASAQKQSSMRVAGRYSDTHYIEEAGDVLGVELRIVKTADGYQGLLPFAEGVPEGAIMVEVKVKGDQVRFSVPDNNFRAAQFRGQIKGAFLRGPFLFKDGTTERVKLPRGKSYWDRGRH